MLRFALILSVFLLSAGCVAPNVKYVNDHPELSELTRDDILNRRVRVGMTEDEAFAAFSGMHIWKRTRSGSTKTMYWGNPSYGLIIVTFRNGVVVNIGDVR